MSIIYEGLRGPRSLEAAHEYYKCCLRIFQRVPQAHILREELKLRVEATSTKASRLYNLFENPRSLEAARGRGHF